MAGNAAESLRVFAQGSLTNGIAVIKIITGDIMRINTRFTVAVHMLALLALNKNEARPSTSELLAKSVGTNPVVIRQLMQMLKKEK